MKQLELVSPEQAPTVSLVETVDEFYRSMEEVVSKGIDPLYNDVALLKIPGREQWMDKGNEDEDSVLTAETDKRADYSTMLTLDHTGKPMPASWLETAGTNHFIRVDNILENYYVTAPAYDMTGTPDAPAKDKLDLDMNFAIGFSGHLFVAAMERADVPIARFHFPLIEPEFKAYYYYDIGSFLLDHVDTTKI
ncbi:MAG TPA: hypothetical protein VFN51_01380 [Candidatus Saccharimonadales bacterium]|nr:hypothetical protein [Candidatus Saccharimonadales bacterium]